MKPYLTIVGVAFVLSLPAAGQAQVPTGDPAAGYMFAHEACAQCHIVSDNQPPPLALAVPSFFSIANDPATTVLSLRSFLRTPHNRMPDFVIERADVDNLIAYILSLRGRERRLPPVPPKPQQKPTKLKAIGA